MPLAQKVQPLHRGMSLCPSMCTNALESMVLKVLQCCLLPVKSLVRVPPVERRVRCPIRQVRRGEHELSLNTFLDPTVCQQASRSSRQSPPVSLRYPYLLRCVDRRVVKVNRSLTTVFPEGLTMLYSGPRSTRRCWIRKPRGATNDWTQR